MKKGILLNAEISAVIAHMGHTDHITIADAGLPIPHGSQRIDVAITHGLPEFMPVFSAITDELYVEKAILAEEITQLNPDVEHAILARLKALEIQQNNKIEIIYCSHQALKQMTKESKAIVRTGECTPYANIILCSGVTF